MNKLFSWLRDLIADLLEQHWIIEPSEPAEKEITSVYRPSFPDPLTEQEIKRIQMLKTEQMDVYESFYEEHRHSIYVYYFIELCQEDKNAKNNKRTKSLAQELAINYFKDFFLNKKYNRIDCCIRQYLFLDVHRNFKYHKGRIKKDSNCHVIHRQK